MNNRKLAIIGAAVFVVICCILAAGCTAEDSAYQPDRVYDLEHHYYLPELIDYLGTRTTYPYYDGSTVWCLEMSGYPVSDDMNFNTEYGIKTEITDLDAVRLGIMDDAGITTGVVSSSYAIELLPKEEAVKYARLTNDAVAQAVKEHPDRFLGTITLPTPYVEESIAELERCVNELGLQYWHTHSNYGTEHLYDEKFEPLLAKCAELDVPIYLHPNTPDNEYFTDSGMTLAGPAFALAVDAMKTSFRLVADGIFDRYPNLTLILGHIGEYYPYSMTRIDNRFAPGDPYIKCKENFTYYFKNRNILITTSGITDPNAVICAINAIGIDGIMFASDYPYENVKEQVEFVKSLPISDEDKDKIFYRNAETYILKDRTQATA